jgi:hypothetical protein
MLNTEVNPPELLPTAAYRINWHISHPYVARAAEMRAFWGGLIL